MTALTTIRDLKSWLGLSNKGRGRVRVSRWYAGCDQNRSCEFLEDRTLLAAAAATALGADRLDTAFGTDGSTTTNFNARGIFAEATSAFASAVVVQPNGKILVAGTVDQGGNRNFAVARYQSNGSLDSSFGTAGKVVISFDLGGNLADVVSGLALQSNGRIVVVGTVDADSSSAISSVGRIALHRFSTTLRVPDASVFPATPFSIEIGDEKILVTAISRDTNTLTIDRAQNGTTAAAHAIGSTIRLLSDRDFAIARLLSNGRLDTSFDGDGKQTVAFDRGGNLQDTASGVVVQSDGKILVVGTATMDDSGDTDFAIARLMSNGQLDLSFDTDGKQTVAMRPNSGLADIAAAIAIGSGGKIIVAGSSEASSGAGHDFAVARLNANGRLDTSFSGDGRATIAFDLGGENDDRGTSLGIQSDGRIVIGGYAQIDGRGNDDFAIVRLNTNGSLDRSFDGDGRVTVSFDVGGTNRDRAASLAIQANGQIVLVGSAQMDAAGDFDFAVARLDRNGGMDTTFDGDGKATIAFDRGGSNADFATGIAIDPNRRLVITGRAANLTSGDFEFALTRLFGLG